MHPSARMSNMEEPASSPESYHEDSFVYKSKICVVCAASIGDDDVGEENDPLEDTQSVTFYQDIFLKGLSVLCEVLDIEPRYANCEEWTVAGVDNFVRAVCCRECYMLLGNVVSLHELIAATQASLQSEVLKIRQYIIQSQETEEEVEYSINACVNFRDHILKNISKTAPPDRRKICTANKRAKSLRESRNISELSTSSLALQDLHKQELGVEPQHKVRSNCVVKLEKLELTEKESQEVVSGSEDDVESNLDLDLPEYHSPHEYESNDESLTSGRKVNVDADTSKNLDIISPTLPRKRGRPRKYPLKILDENAVKRKRGRPRKFPQETGPVVKRKRGRPRKNEATEDDKVDKEYIPIKRKFKKCLISKLKIATKKQQPSSQSDNTLAEKRGRGRPCKYDKNVVPEGPKRTPIFATDILRGVFMYLNIKFQKVDSTLLCKHPGCSHVITIKGYFTDQAAFNTMRLHIRNLHRSKYKPLGGCSNKYQFCFYCEMSFKTRRELWLHQQDVHPDALLPLTLCEICGDIMDHQLIFKHVITHKSDEEKARVLPIKPPEPPIKKVTTKSRVQFFPCSQCTKVFRTKGQQKIHKLSHIPIELRRQVICDLCGAKVSSFSNLKSHKRHVHFRHEVPTAYECHICGKTYLQSEGTRYRAHMNVHTGECPFQCSQCGKRFRAKRSLKLHERTHEETSIQCAFCPKWYKDDKYLKRHQLAHHVDLMPQSDKSQCSSQQRENFIGPKLMYPCEPCSQVFQYKSRLVKHLKHKHKLFLEKSEDYPDQVTLEDNII